MFDIENYANNENADLVMGVFDSVEKRWEAGSQCLMRLMEFSLEALKIALIYGREHKVPECTKYLNKSSHFVKTGAKMMATFGDIPMEEYNVFRDTRDIHGSITDKRLIDLHVMQREVMKDLIRVFFYNININEIDINGPEKEVAEQIKQHPELRQLTDAMIYADETHKGVFAAHTWVCKKVVQKGEPSIRGNYIEMFQNRDFVPVLIKLKQWLKEGSHKQKED